jgi:hypothetical protein
MGRLSGSDIAEKILQSLPCRFSAGHGKKYLNLARHEPLPVRRASAEGPSTLNHETLHCGKGSTLLTDAWRRLARTYRLAKDLERKSAD